MEMLRNPTYAGIYARGRNKTETVLDASGHSQKRRRRLARVSLPAGCTARWNCAPDWGGLTAVRGLDESIRLVIDYILSAHFSLPPIQKADLVSPQLSRKMGLRPFGRQFQPRNLHFEPLEPRALLAAVASTQVLDTFSITNNVGEKPESKIWKHADRWWGVFSDSSGSYVWRLDGTKWTKALQISSAKSIRVDAKPQGNVTHVLFENNSSSQLFSLEYVSGSTPTYKPWSGRTSPATVPLASSTQSATIDIDSTNRMWVAYDEGGSKISVRYSDAPYSTWSSPIVLAANVASDDIAALAALANGTIGVLWSNQNTGLFGFRTHVDGTSPTVWNADEQPASQSVISDSGTFADNHINLAVGSDGMLYAGVKTGYHDLGSPEMGILARRPNGTWDDFHVVDIPDGTRPILQLNEAAKTLIFSYDDDSDWVYHECSTTTFSCSAAKILLSNGDNGTSTKQTVTTDLVILTSGKSTSGSVWGAKLTFDTSNAAPTVDAGPNQSIYDTQVASLQGVAGDDGRPNPPASITATWSKVSGPGTVSFTDASNLNSTVSFGETGVYVLKLTATDGELTSSDTTTVTVMTTPVNQPPTVDAGDDHSVGLLDTLSLDGTVSDDGLPFTPGAVTTQWSQVTGPGTAAFGNTANVDTSVSFSAIGTYTLRLTAFDGQLTATDDMEVTVEPLPPNKAPVVHAGSDQTVFLGVAAALSGSFADDNQPVPQAAVTTTWSKVSGPGTVTFLNPAQLQTSASFSQTGTYELKLAADDSELVGSDTVTITVSDTPPPKETIAFQSGVLPTASYGGARDTKLRADNQTTNYGTNSKLELDGKPDFTSLLKWDVSAIPVGSTVIGATITVNVVNTSLHTFPIYELSRDWVETQATYLQSATNVAWSTVGAAGVSDREPTVLGTITAPKLESVTLSLNAAGIAVVQKWVSNPASNYGLTIQNYDDISTDDLDFSSREDSTSSRRPKLTIEYWPTSSVPPPGPTNQPPMVNAGPDVNIGLADLLQLDGTVSDDGLPSTPGAVTTQWSLVSGPGTAAFGNSANVDTSVSFSAIGTYTLRLTSFDGQLTATDDIVVIVEPLPTNQAPVVNAGSDQTILLGNSAALSGSFTDDHRPDPPASVTTTWSKLSGPGTVTFVNASLPQTSVGFSQAGIYELQLSANDSQLTGTDTVKITVNDPASASETISFQSGLLPTPAYNGARDTKLREDNQTTNFGTNYKLELDGNPNFTSLLRWDLSLIPTGATVASAAITVNVLEASVATFPIYELTRDWVETQATYLNSAINLPWSTPGAAGIGGDRANTVLGTITAPSLGNMTISLNGAGIAVVQNWISNPAANRGLVIQNYDNLATDDLDFSSREESTPSKRPKLTIEYFPFSSSIATATLLHNSVNPLDVNADTQVTPLDALALINALNRGSFEGEAVSLSTMYFDVSGDGTVTPLDALLVINHLNNSQSLSVAGEASTPAVDFVIADWREDDELFEFLELAQSAAIADGHGRG